MTITPKKIVTRMVHIIINKVRIILISLFPPSSALCLPREIHGNDSEAYFTGVIRPPTSDLRSLTSDL